MSARPAVTFDFEHIDLRGVGVTPTFTPYQPPQLPACVVLSRDEENILRGDPAPGLTLDAYEALIARLKSGGNRPGTNHRLAVLRMLSQMTRHAHGTAKGRVPITLPTGLGKTQGFIAWCAAAYRAGYFDGTRSVAIAAMRVEALCEVLRDLVSAGIPSGFIGLMHSVAYDRHAVEAASAAGLPAPAGVASEPNDPAASTKPILLATHAAIRKGVTQRFNRYNGHPRSLLIWDEALIVSEADHMDTVTLDFALRGLSPYLQQTTATLAFLKDATACVQAEVLRQREGQVAQSVDLPPVDAKIVEAELLAIKRRLFQPHQRQTVEDLIRFVKMAQYRLAVAATGQATGLITYQITIPAELDSIIILDASFPIRRLCHYDRTLLPTLTLPTDLKRYDNVVVNHIKSASGKVEVTDSLSRLKHRSPFVQCVVEVMQSIPLDEGVIIFGLKSQPSVDHVQLIREALTAAGINIDARLPNGLRRINFLTWGNETSLSNLKHCKNVIFAAVLNRKLLDLYASICGQSDDLTARFGSEALSDVAIGELVHMLYQAISRGACRVVDDGQAMATNVWLPLPDARIRPVLEGVMPGLRWRTVALESIGKLTKADQLAELVASQLNALPKSQQRVSCRWLCSQIPALNAVRGAKTKSQAISRGAELTGSWAKAPNGRSVIRVR